MLRNFFVENLTSTPLTNVGPFTCETINLHSNGPFHDMNPDYRFPNMSEFSNNFNINKALNCQLNERIGHINGN